MLVGLYYITHILNVPSILEKGILCRRLVEERNIQHLSISKPEIVAKRKMKKLPNGKTLWDYANLFFQPKNPMLYRVIKDQGEENIAIIEIRESILLREDLLITDGNAASEYTNIWPIQQARKYIENIREEIDKELWIGNDEDLKRKFMAECLVPYEVAPEYIIGVYVSSDRVAYKLKSGIPQLNIPIIPEPALFFSSSQQSFTPLLKKALPRYHSLPSPKDDEIPF